MAEENKESRVFSVKNIFWGLLLASLGAIITLAYQEYNKDIRELLVANDDSVSLINGALPKQITSDYFLANEPSKKVKSLFFKKIAIKNNGNTDGENIPFSVFLKGENIFLIDNPTIKTNPKEIIDIIEIKKEANSTNTKHIWNITLLKPEETVTFEYMIYSEDKIRTPEVNILVRKKNWISKKGVFSDSEPKVTIIQFCSVFTFVLLITSVLFVLGIKVAEKRKRKTKRY